MAKCVVCSKSAGPFYSLHKTCLSVYQDTRKCLEDKLSDCTVYSENSSDIIANVYACKPSTRFSQPQFKKLVQEAWQIQAEQVVKSSTLNPVATKNLLLLAVEFNLDKDDMDEHLIIRLSNVEHLDRLQKNQPFYKHMKNTLVEVELEQQELIIWEFKDTTKAEQQRFSQEKQWTVLNSVLNNILMKKRYKQLAVKTEESGALIVTNQGLYYKNNKSISRIKFSDIYSITPMKDGIRIQANLNDAMPETYITGDGRFTYALLQYAQGLAS